jgi:hypothetical protein
MKGLLVSIGITFIFANSGIALGDAACEQCIRDLETQIAKCMQSGKDRVTCIRENRTPQQRCSSSCQTHP